MNEMVEVYGLTAEKALASLDAVRGWCLQNAERANEARQPNSAEALLEAAESAKEALERIRSVL